MNPTTVLRHRAARWALGPLVALMVASTSLAAAPSPAAEAPPSRTWQRQAVPYYTPSQWVGAVWHFHQRPRAKQFALDAQTLAVLLERTCARPPASDTPAQRREAWSRTLDSWSALSAVAIGPTLERRSVRHIDFQPARPAMIGQVLASPPTRLDELDRIGAPARGLPALEWWLWSPDAPQDAAACQYATLLARQVAQEALALLQGVQARIPDEGSDDEPADAAPAFGEIVNQWVGAIEGLRWRELGKPLASARLNQPPRFSRQLSGQSARAWMAQWAAIRDLAVQTNGPAPQAGEGPIPLETYLRGRGLNGPAQALSKAVRDADRHLKGLSEPAPAKRVRAAVRSLEQLKRVAETQVAPALQVSLGFSDADGD